MTIQINLKRAQIIMKKRKIFLTVVIASTLTLGGIAISILSNPIRRTENSIRNYLLQMTPVGTSMEDVIYIINGNNQWEVRDIRENEGVAVHIREGRRPEPTRFVMDYSSTVFVGERSVNVHLGSYRVVLITRVTAFYAFDENGELMDIFIRQDYDVG